ncbi:UNVERIFIED_CONTAM: hypothetical protein Sindi_0736100 [Sesamum indicum]
MDPIVDPPRRSTFSDITSGKISPTLLGAIQQVVAAAIREQMEVLLPTRQVPGPPRAVSQEVSQQWLAHMECLQKGLLDVQHQIARAPEDDHKGIPFTEAVMADELPANCRTPNIIEYNGTTDPQEHLSRFESAALFHRWDQVSCLCYHIYQGCTIVVQSVARGSDRKF